MSDFSNEYLDKNIISNRINRYIDNISISYGYKQIMIKPNRGFELYYLDNKVGRAFVSYDDDLFANSNIIQVSVGGGKLEEFSFKNFKTLPK